MSRKPSTVFLKIIYKKGGSLCVKHIQNINRINDFPMDERRNTSSESFDEIKMIMNLFDNEEL